MNIAKNTVVSLNYTLKNPEGAVLDESPDGDPLVYLHGSGQLIPGLEKALEGKGEGDKFSVTIPPSDGYGERDEEAVRVATRDQFPADAEIEIGMRFQAEAQGMAQVVTVTEVDGDKVTLDFNHPLAGVPLHFDVAVVGVRVATKEDLAAHDCDHDHGPSCGCDH